MLRRRFLQGALAGVSAWLAGPWRARAADPAADLDRWAVLAATLERLLPDDGDGPGARELGAAGYLRAALAGPRIPADERRFVLQGAEWLDDAARQEAGAPFTALPAAEQDAVLTTIARSTAGERWLAHLLDYGLEALLADPVYGANPGGAGWAWLAHRPGLPRPPAGKTSPALAARWQA